MATLLRQANDLAVLRIRLAHGRERSVVAPEVRRSEPSAATAELEFQIGNDDPIPVASCRTSELGIGYDADALAGVDAVRELPPRLEEAIAERLYVLGGHSSVWLEFTTPSGYLTSLPWEQWLVPVVRRAVLRLPYFALRPRSAVETLDVVLCATSPTSRSPFPADYMLRLASTIADMVPRDVTLHLFTDSEAYPKVRARAADLPARTFVHDPYDARRYAPPRREADLDDSYDVTNPWLLWIRDALGGRSADVLHFLCHGYLFGDRGALVFASSPLERSGREYSGCVGLSQVSTLMTQLGAWSFAVSGPAHNYSQTALRQLGDGLARTGPSYVLVHDARSDPGFADAAAMYGFLYPSVSSSLPPRAAAVTCWAHPQLVEEFPAISDSTSPGAGLLSEDGSSSVFEPETEDAIASEGTPAWLASSTRLIERAQGSWLNASAAEEDATPSVSATDAEAALRNVTELLERHVRAERETPYEEGPL